MRSHKRLPASEAAWRQAIMAAHPDRVGGSATICADLTAARGRWRARQHCHCGRRLPRARKMVGTCCPLCEQSRPVTVKSVLRLNPAPLNSRCEWHLCRAVLIQPTRQRKNRSLKRFCNNRCAASWLQASMPKEILRRGGRHAAAVNNLHAAMTVADRFRHIGNLDDRVRHAHLAGWQAGYQARIRHERAEGVRG